MKKYDMEQRHKLCQDAIDILEKKYQYKERINHKKSVYDVGRAIFNLFKIELKNPKNSSLPFWNGVLRNFIINDGRLIPPIKPFVFQNKKVIFSSELENSKKRYNSYRAFKNKFKDFYSSSEWRKLRYEVLREQGGRCCLCGRTAKDGVIIHVDHIIPISKCPQKALDKNNLQVLCEDCNLGKLNTDSINWKDR